MNRQEFEAKNEEKWADLDLKLRLLEGGHKVEGLAKVPALFREVARDLSLAQYRMFGDRVIGRLNDLAIQGHRLFASTKGLAGEGALSFVLRKFPQAIRREQRLFWLSSLLFWGPFFLMWFSTKMDITWVQALLGPQQLSDIESMYGEEDTVAYLRQQFGSNFQMFAHYIQNNVGIDFMLYAGGLVYGLGTIYILVINGLSIGGVVGYVDYAGDPEKLWSFVAGHSSFELLGMVVVAMAGLKLGFAMLAPGQLKRGVAMAKAGRDGLPFLIGGSCLTALAAVVEGFWSAQIVPVETKYTVGIFFWVLHFLYFAFAGRGRSEA